MSSVKIIVGMEFVEIPFVDYRLPDMDLFNQYDPPANESHPAYKRWYASRKATYFKRCRGVNNKFSSKEEFIDFCDRVYRESFDVRRWMESVEKYPNRKNPGRPRLRKKKLKPKTPRHVEMRKLLEDSGIELDGNTIIGYEDFEFMNHGRIKFIGDEEHGIEPYIMSVHGFLSKYVPEYNKKVKDFK